MNRLHGHALPAIAVLLSLFSLFFWTTPVWAGRDQRIVTVHAVGSSSIHGEDLSSSQKAAKAASLVSAVTEVLMEIAPPDLIVGHFQVVSENILSKPDKFIIDYQMLTDSKHANQVRVMVRARVSVQRLKDALKKSGIYVGQKAYPKVLFCLAEKQVNDVNFQYWWGGQQFWRAGISTEAITKISKEKGLVVINPNANNLSKAYSPQLSVSEAVALANDLKADIVVIGQAVAQDAPNTMGGTLQSFRGTLSARAYRVKNGEEIGQVQQVAISTSGDSLSGGKDALEKVSLLAGQNLTEQITQVWFTEGGGTSTIEIWVEGLSGNIANFVKFRGALSGMSGVNSVQRKEMKLDTAVLLIDYQGNTRALADALMLQNFDTFKLTISEPDDNTIRLKLLPR